MKLKLLLLICLFSSVNSFSQTIEETIDYINQLSYDCFDNLNLKYPVFDGSFRYNEDKVRVFCEDVIFLKRYFEISVNEKGLLTIYNYKDVYIIPKGTPFQDDYESNKYIRKLKDKKVIETYQRVYLKQLKDSIDIRQKYDLKLINDSLQQDRIFSVLVFCNNDVECIDHFPFCNRIATKELQIRGLRNVLRLKFALQHLIKLAKENPDYWEQDPFE